ncbi:MAG: 23S rRNA (uridine(2552)-2'-O)-methyltransferase [Thermoplasmata archaeon HGW-Thermoplasmata-1]|nr:MAG: 23S rRNA (uridine(2552)-2'-O)-methyltransferase [Thermoplasmata archaeon HGW-Thermoplasmata-1]
MAITRWYKEKKREHFYNEAKRLGYRARSAFKLIQINEKFGIIKKGDVVVDLGCSPGGWCQVALELTGGEGVVVGVDLLPTEPISGVRLMRGDMTTDETVERLLEVVNEKSVQAARPDLLVDCVLSDMSPDISGHYTTDQARSIWLCYRALEFARKVLREEGGFACKVFEGEDFIEFRSELKRWFRHVRPFSPPASRKSSSEIYLVAKGFRAVPLPKAEPKRAAKSENEDEEEEAAPRERFL